MTTETKTEISNNIDLIVEMFKEGKDYREVTNELFPNTDHRDLFAVLQDLGVINKFKHIVPKATSALNALDIETIESMLRNNSTVQTIYDSIRPTMGYSSFSKYIADIRKQDPTLNNTRTGVSELEGLKDEITACIKKGFTYREVAKELGIDKSTSTINNFCIKYGINELSPNTVGRGKKPNKSKPVIEDTVVSDVFEEHEVNIAKVYTALLERKFNQSELEELKQIATVAAGVLV